MSQLVFLDQSTLPNVDLKILRDMTLPFVGYPHTEPKDVVSRLANATVAIVNKVVLNADTLAQLPLLKLICVTATGINNIDLFIIDKI